MTLLLRLLVLAAGLSWSAAALAEARIALLIGNGNYTAVQPLANPVNDVSAMARTLEDLGFEVTLLADADAGTMSRGIADFGRRLRTSGPETTGLFYFAGHGVQSFGDNYLLPVDVNLTDAADLGLVAIEANLVLRQMASARNRTNIVILDACRNNPFAAVPDLGDNGLAEMKAPTGTFLAYATAPGAVALDGEGANSPFTSALVDLMATPGLPIEQLFREVRVRVLDLTAGQQTPWDTSSLTREFAFQPGRIQTPEEIAEEQFWLSVREAGDPVQVMLFLRAYPDGRYAAEARSLLAEAMQTLMAPTPPAGTLKETQPFAPSTPSPGEDDLIKTAQQSGAKADYEAYLAAFPAGTYAELARLEIAALEAAAAAASAPDATAPAAPPPAAAPAETAMVAAPKGPITFTSPLTSGGPAVEGKSIEQLIQGYPLFPPIEGLPDEVWKNKTCSTCHEWTRERLCEQGKTYTVAAGERALTKSHPYGGGLKQALRAWVLDGCNG